MPKTTDIKSPIESRYLANPSLTDRLSAHAIERRAREVDESPRVAIPESGVLLEE